MRRARPGADLLLDALNGLLARPMRALLLAGVFALGSGGFAAALGISETAAVQLTQRLSPGDLDEVHLALPDELRDEAQDLADRAHTVSGVTSVGLSVPLSPEASRASAYERPVNAAPAALAPRVLGADPRWLSLERAATSPGGAAWQLAAENLASGVALVGDGAARELGIPAAGPGRAVWVGGRRLDVVGIIVTSDAGADLHRAVVVSLETAAAVEPAATRQLLVKTESGHAKSVADRLPYVLAPTSPTSIHVEPVIDLGALRRGVATDLDRTVAFGSGLVLLLAGLAVANAMVVAIVNRRGEIGLRRALGASRGSIARLFLVEALIVGLVGGIMGLPLGMGATLLVAAQLSWQPALSVHLALLAPAAGVAAALVFSAYPAMRAARIEPAEAVRHE